jgi:hypothetical protein
MPCLWRSRACSLKWETGHERKGKKPEAKAPPQQASPSLMHRWGQPTRRYQQSFNGCAPGERPRAEAGDLHQIVPNCAKLRKGHLPARTVASQRRVKATHLAKTVESPKPKVRFSQAVASYRNLRFFGKGVESRRAGQRGLRASMRENRQSKPST